MLILMKFLWQQHFSFGIDILLTVLNTKHLIVYIYVNDTLRTDVECSTIKYIRKIKNNWLGISKGQQIVNCIQFFMPFNNLLFLMCDIVMPKIYRISTNFNATQGVNLISSFISARPEHGVDNLFQVPAAYDFQSLKTLRS